jgi:hypothetical protein
MGGSRLPGLSLEKGIGESVMSEAPTNSAELAQQMVDNAMSHWMQKEAERLSADVVDGSPKTLEPSMSHEANELLGLPGRESSEPATKMLPPESSRVMRVWFSTGDELSQDVVAGVVNSLKWITHLVIVTCSGNAQGITYRFTVHTDDFPALQAALMGGAASCHIEEEDGTLQLEQELASYASCSFSYRTLSPPLPYWGVFEDKAANVNGIHAALMELGSDGYGIYQLVFAPITPGWHTLIRTMVKTEDLISSRGRSQGNWVPSQEAARASAKKLSNPLFAVSVRIGMFAKPMPHQASLLNGLTTAIAGVHFSGSPLSLVDGQALLAARASKESIVNSFTNGVTFTHGAIMSADEIAMFMRYPTKEALANPAYGFDTIPVFIANLSRAMGTVLASEHVYGKKHPIIWPDKLRTTHMVVTGATGSGKTMFAAGLCSRIVSEHPKEGLALIDPHGTAVEEFLRCVDEDRLDDVILHDPMDDEYILCLPMVDCPDLDQLDAAVSNISRQFASLFSRSDMGFNIQRAMKQCIRTVLLCPELSLVDVRSLLDTGYKGKDCRDRVCATIPDEALIDYWMNGFKALDNSTIGRIRSRFEHIFEPYRLRKLLANKIGKITYREIIDQGKIFLAMTSPGMAGADLASTLGTLHLTGFHSAAPAREGQEGQRPIFTIVADEFGNYANPKTVPHALRTLRHCDVSQILLPQNISALPEEVRQGLGNVNTHVAFRQGWDDAQFYFKMFGGIVPATNFMSTNPGQGYARIGDRSAQIVCDLPARLRGTDVLKEVRANTRRKYCVRKDQLIEQNLDEKRVTLDELKDLDVL